MDRAQILTALAEVGSIEGVLARYGSLSRAAVVEALHDAARVAEQPNEPEPFSPIYRAYNGLMLGLFTAGSLLFDHVGKQRRRDDVRTGARPNT